MSEKLTYRECEICALVLKSQTNKEIAATLHLAEGTIKEYLHRLFQKLSVSNRTALALKYRDMLEALKTDEHSAVSS